MKSAADNEQSALAGKIAHKIGHESKSNKTTLKVQDQEERLTKWKKRFQNLPGKSPKVAPQET